MVDSAPRADFDARHSLCYQGGFGACEARKSLPETTEDCEAALPALPFDATETRRPTSGRPGEFDESETANRDDIGGRRVGISVTLEV